MDTEPKLIPLSRIAPATNTSREFVRLVVRRLETEGEIQPEWTATGRGYLNVPEWEKVRSVVAG